MNKLLIIDDDQCKSELSAFIKTHPACVKVFIDIEDENPGVNQILKHISSIYYTQKKISINTAESLAVVNISDIVRCESQGNYTNLHFSNQKTIISSKTLKEFDQRLESYNFLRIHRSHLINLNYLDKYVKSKGGYVVLKDGSEIPVSSRKRKKLLELMEKL